MAYIFASFPKNTFPVIWACAISGEYLLLTYLWQYHGKLKFYIVLFFNEMYSNVGFICKHSSSRVGHMSNEADIFVQRHMLIM